MVIDGQRIFRNCDEWRWTVFRERNWPCPLVAHASCAGVDLHPECLHPCRSGKCLLSATRGFLKSGRVLNRSAFQVIPWDEFCLGWSAWGQVMFWSWPPPHRSVPQVRPDYWLTRKNIKFKFPATDGGISPWNYSTDLCVIVFKLLCELEFRNCQHLKFTNNLDGRERTYGTFVPGCLFLLDLSRQTTSTLVRWYVSIQSRSH